MSSKIKLILAVSIVLNFLFIGLIVGSYSTRYMYKWGMRHYSPEIIENLPKDKQDLVISKMEQLYKVKRENWKKIRKTKSELISIIKAPEFNENLYDQKVNELHSLYREMAVSLAQSIKDLAREFNPEERAVLSQFLNKRHRKGMHRRFYTDDRE
jgi:uncharacterized membrane protein